MRKQILLISIVFMSWNFSFAGSSVDVKPVIVTSGSSSPSINQSSDTAQKQNKKAQGVSQIIGVGMMVMGAYCASQCPAVGCCSMAPMYFIMGAMSFQQAGANGSAAGQAGQTNFDSSAQNPFGDPGAETNYLDPNTSLDPTVSSVVNSKGFNDTRKALLSSGGLNGFKMDKKTGIVTDPSGKTYDPSKLSDKASLAKSGFSDSGINDAYGFASKLESEAKKKLGATTEGIGAATAEHGYRDGGGASNAGVVASTPSENSGGLVRKPAGVNKLAGLTKNFKGERIGVAAENIFTMMTRRFKSMEKRDSFIDPSELIPLEQ